MDICAGIVGIKSDPKSKTILGTGFFVSGGLILTCAHVIADYYQPGGKIDFQLKGQVAEFKANVIYFSSKSEYDLAILKPSEEVDFTPLSIASSQNSKGNSFSIFGYPNINFEGLNGAGRIMGWTKERGKDFSVLQLKSDEITHGFSGAPIWDEKLKFVVGLLQQGIKNEDIGKPSFALPIEFIKRIYPTLALNVPSKNDLAIREELAVLIEKGDNLFQEGQRSNVVKHKQRRTEWWDKVRPWAKETGEFIQKYFGNIGKRKFYDMTNREKKKYSGDEGHDNRLSVLDRHLSNARQVMDGYKILHDE